MKIGIIGTGNIGSNLARLFIKAGHKVIITYSRSPEKLQALAQQLGPNATVGSIYDAVHQTDLTVLSIRLVVLDEVKSQMGDFKDKIIIDTNNPFGIQLMEGVTAASEINRRLPGINLIKAFNTLYYQVLLSGSFSKPLLISPVSGNDPVTKEVVKLLISSIGFEAFDLGTLDQVWMQEPNGPFYNRSINREEAKKILENTKLLSR